MSTTDKPTDQPEQMPLTSMDVAAEKREQLKALFPEVFAEDKIDFDQLRRVLGEWVEPDRERFGLNWPGKAACMQIIQQPSIATLKPDRAESVNFDETENLFIEGDNLEVLKLLQKAYFGKVKMIYIDPPYNTGKEFIYPDKYAETLDTYLRYTGQIDDNGHKFTTNTDSVGRYHSNWLNMMYPRLYLARNLLREDGVIFISIDDHEQANLKALCDLIFGEENFLQSFVWRRRKTQANLARFIATVHDYILCYARNITESVINPIPYTKEYVSRTFSNPDSDPKGPYQTGPLARPQSSNNLEYELTMPNGRRITAKWSCTQETFDRYIAENRLVIPRDGEGMPRIKIYLTESKGQIPNSWLDGIATNDEASAEIQDLFGSTAFFSYPKPVGLLRHLLIMATNPDDIVLDFFAGSGSIAHTVINMNTENDSRRKFICVQLPEPTDEQSEARKAGYETIADIAKERIRRAAQKIADGQNGELAFDPDHRPDLGFRVFRLAPSNFRRWEGDPEQLQRLEQQLFAHVDHIHESSTPEDILYELLLKAGYPLTTHVETRTLAGKTVYAIEGGDLLICLERALTEEVLDAMADAHPRQVICLDAGFQGNDQLKANAVQTFRIRAEREESEIVFRTV